MTISEYIREETKQHHRVTVDCDTTIFPEIVPGWRLLNHLHEASLSVARCKVTYPEFRRPEIEIETSFPVENWDTILDIKERIAKHSKA